MANENSEQRNCVRGVRFSYVYNATVSLIAPPRSGHIALIGPGFSYTAKSGFRGEDSFIVGILGSKNKTNGYSIIRVIVSVIDVKENATPAFARFEPNQYP